MSIVTEIVKDSGYSITNQFIKPSTWTRPQIKITPQGGIIHWTGNIKTGSNAKANRNFFNNRTGSYGSAHVIGDDKEIIAALPYLKGEAEMGYHVGATKYLTNMFGSYPNNATIGYEMCVNMDGDFRETYKRAVWTMAYWCYLYGWNPKEKVKRHYDITGKDCPLMMTDYIFNVNHVRNSVASMYSNIKDVSQRNKLIEEGTNFIINKLHIDGIKGNDLFLKYVSDVAELTEIMKKNNGNLKNINLEDDDKLKFEHDWQWKMLGDALDGLYRKSVSGEIKPAVITDYKWAEKAYKRELTQSELAWLSLIVFAKYHGVKI